MTTVQFQSRPDPDPPTRPHDVQRRTLVNYGGFAAGIRVDQHHVRGLSLHFAQLSADGHTLFGVELDLDHVGE